LCEKEVQGEVPSALEEHHCFALAELLKAPFPLDVLLARASEYRIHPSVLFSSVSIAQDRVDEVVQAVHTDKFDVFAYGPYDLEYGIAELLSPYISHWQWSVDQLRALVASVHSLYRNSPYHNWYHAVDVVQFMSQALKLPQLQYLFSPVEIASTILAGLTHDIDHDGVTNKGHMALNSERHRHSAKATQEIHHCAIAKKLLSIGRLDRSINNRIITALIEATDMATHTHYCKEFEKVIQAMPNKTNFIESEHDRLLLLIVIMKAADLSNTVRRTETARKWGDLLGNEFHLAYLKEKAAHVPQSKLSFHGDPSQGHDKLQLGFFKGVVFPFYSLLNTCPLLKQFVEPLIKNASSSVAYFEDAAAKDVSSSTPAYEDEV